MSFGIRLHVWGEFACFTRPEMKVERVSYDVMTPSAARGLLEAIHWKPAIRWVIDRIHVLKPIRFQSIRRNEVGAKISESNVRSAMKAGSTAGLGLAVDENRQQRAATVLRDVAYLIEAHFELTEKAKDDDTPAKHAAMFNRRAVRAVLPPPLPRHARVPAEFRLIRDGDDAPPCELPLEARDRDLGWMLYDIDFADGAASRFFRARLENAVLDLRRAREEGLAS